MTLRRKCRAIPSGENVPCGKPSEFQDETYAIPVCKDCRSKRKAITALESAGLYVGLHPKTKFIPCRPRAALKRPKGP